MGTLRDGKYEDGEVDFRDGVKTQDRTKGDQTTLDPKAGSGDSGYDDNESTNPGVDIDTEPPPTGTDPNDPLPPTQETVPDVDPIDYSGEVGQNTPDIDAAMDYEVPEAGDVPFVTSSGTASPTMTPWEVTPEQTVQGQLTQLYDRDSPFFEQARQRAIRQSLSSGGQNSAMAGAFGELAAMDTAFKVGFADAATYARSAEFNAAMANQFSLAEQQFVHNALLSDQSYRQARELQTQRIAGQMEAIILDYKGRSTLMDQEMQNWFLQAKQTHQYSLDMLYEQASLAEGQAGRDFARTMVLNGMNTMTNFYTNAFAAVMQYANNPNFTPAQQQAAAQQGMLWANQQWEMLQAYWGQWAAGGPPLFVGNSNWFDFNQPFTGG